MARRDQSNWPPWVYVILHFSHDRSTWSPSFSGNTVQNFPAIADPFAEVSKFQHHIMLCSKYSTLPVSSLSSSPILRWKDSSSCWMLILPWKSWIQFHLNVLHRCHYATQIVETFTLSGDFWYIIISVGGGFLEIRVTLVFSTWNSIPYNLPILISLLLSPESLFIP